VGLLILVLRSAQTALMANHRSGENIKNTPGIKASKNTTTNEALMAMSVGMSRTFIPQIYHRGCSVLIHERECPD